MKSLFLFLAIISFSPTWGQGPLRTATELSDFRKNETSSEQRGFDLKGVVSFELDDRYFLLTDDSGGTILESLPGGPRITVGDVLHIQGTTIRFAKDQHVPQTTNLNIVGRQSVPPIVSADIKDIRLGRFDNRLVKTTGLVIDATVDEIVGQSGILVLYDRGDTITIATAAYITWLNGLVGTRISVTGVCNPRIGGYRIFHRHGINASPKGIKVLETAAEGIRRTKDIRSLRASDYEVVNGNWERFHIVGTVTAIQSRNRILVQTSDGWVSQVFLAGGQTPPKIGQGIKAVGFPETDMFTINLSAALWEEVPGLDFTDPPPVDISIRQVVIHGAGTHYLKVPFHGKPVRLKGKVLNTPTEQFHDPVVHLDCDGFIVSVDVSALCKLPTSLPVGSIIEITGICMLETETGRPSTPFPRINGLRILTRRPSDIRILAHPPWWTPVRLAVVIGSLLAALLAILVWNRILQHLVERRGRQLFREQIARTASELKTEERTRLAVELHDAMSQNISSATLQINAAERLADTDRAKERHHLQIAAKTLHSCREELRNCIWDLRNQSFDEPDLNKAITRMLHVLVDEVCVSVRFNVPRNRLSDNTVHAILKTIRELVVNAVRHGKAASVQIAGALDGGRIRFSVTDDGTGFDPDNCPGIADGHFGLQGIRERVRQLQGTLEIKSAPNAGTRVVITLNAPVPKTEDKDTP